MRTFSTAKSNIYELDPDVQLLKKLNDIIYQLKEYEFDNDISLIKAEFYTVRNAFLTACVNEINDHLNGIDQKNKVRLEVEAQISQFEEFIKGETSGIMQTY